MNRKIQFTQNNPAHWVLKLYIRICRPNARPNDGYFLMNVQCFLAMASVCNIVSRLYSCSSSYSKSQVCAWRYYINILHDKLLILINNLLAIFTFLSHHLFENERMVACEQMSICYIDRLYTNRIYVFICVCAFYHRILANVQVEH